MYKTYNARLVKKVFPFVNKMVKDLDLEKPWNITVKAGDPKIYDYTGIIDSYQYCCGGYSNHKLYYVIDFNNEITPLEHSVDESTGSGRNYEYEAPTNGEQIIESGMEVAYIVESCYEDTDANGNGKESLVWTIHDFRKIEKTKLIEYYEEKFREALNCIMDEIRNS